MKRVAVLAVVLGSLACSGPQAPGGDAGFGTTTVPATGGSSGTGTGGYATGTGGYATGTGGSSGTAGYPGTDGGTTTWRGDAAMEDNSGAGGGGRGKNKNADAAINAVCPPGAMTGAACNIPFLTCVTSSGDGGAQQVCSCPRKGGWTCR
jgi:hypothetical protein